MAAVPSQTFTLERNRVAHRADGEGSFNILYQLIAGADESLRSELLLNAPIDPESRNLYLQPHEDVSEGGRGRGSRGCTLTYQPPHSLSSLRVQSTCGTSFRTAWRSWRSCQRRHLAFGHCWQPFFTLALQMSRKVSVASPALLFNCCAPRNPPSKLPVWFFPLPFPPPLPPNLAGAAVRGIDFFQDPAAAQRAATVLGVDHEDLARDIFNPSRGASTRLSSLFSQLTPNSPTPSDTSSVSGSIFTTSPMLAQAGRTSFLDAFVTGLYEQAFNALVLLINRAIQAPAGTQARSSIHVLDTPG